MTERTTGRRVALLRWLPTLGLMGLIFVLSSQSGLAISEDVSVDRPLRGLAHLASYATLAALLLFALSGGWRPTLGASLIALAVAVLYGAGDELHQSLVPTRNGRVDDLVIDAIGALVGIGVGYVVLARRSSRRERETPPRTGPA